MNETKTIFNNDELLKRYAIREFIIAKCVEYLKEFGYSDVTAENIFTDDVYSQMFRGILLANLEGADEITNDIIEQLLLNL